ncbi:unnamed protein product, partial [marine sediment metagenome]
AKKKMFYLNAANSGFVGEKGDIHLIELGEASC